jgi:threonyl-tRNA synthetase
MVQITLPDGSLREFPGPVTVAEVAASIGAGLAKAALAGKVDGKVVDTSLPIAANAQLAIITAKDADGLGSGSPFNSPLVGLCRQGFVSLKPKSPSALSIENGFYYDFSYSRPFTPGRLTAAIEKRMTELANKDEPVVRRVSAAR